MEKRGEKGVQWKGRERCGGLEVGGEAKSVAFFSLSLLFGFDDRPLLLVSFPFPPDWQCLTASLIPENIIIQAHSFVLSSLSPSRARPCGWRWPCRNCTREPSRQWRNRLLPFNGPVQTRKKALNKSPAIRNLPLDVNVTPNPNLALFPGFLG